MDEKENFTDFSKKQEIWSASTEKDDFYEFDPQAKIKKILKDSKEEFIIVGEYKVEPDNFEKLQKSSNCKMPLWLTFLLGFICIMLVITSLAAILVTTLAKNYASYNENCDSTRKCDTEKNLNCTNGVCVCGSSSLIWVSSNSKCESKKSYGQTCSSTSECFDSTGLFCANSPSGCNCPVTSVANMCDCQLTQYYDQTANKCVNRLSYGSACTFSAQCELGKNFVCTSSAVCGCSNSYYYLGSDCVKKSQFEGVCDATIPCDDTKGLICDAGLICKCNSTHYYDLSAKTCVLKKGILESCTTSDQCEASFICDPNVCKCQNNFFWSHASSACISCPTPNYDFYEDSICARIDSNTSCPISSSEQLYVASSDAEFDLLQSYLTSKANFGSLWVGAKKNGSVYQWLDNSILATNSYIWCSGEPKNTGDCVLITYENAEFCLKTELCGQTYENICQKFA